VEVVSAAVNAASGPSSRAVRVEHSDTASQTDFKKTQAMVKVDFMAFYRLIFSVQAAGL
jgi:hypothetical protein